MTLDEKYNVRVSTRHYKGPELLTNDTVVFDGNSHSLGV